MPSIRSLSAPARQWPEVSDFVACFCTLCKSKNLLPFKNLMPFLHGSRFFDLLNVQKSVTQIIYVRPLPSASQLSAIIMLIPLMFALLFYVSFANESQQWSLKSSNVNCTTWSNAKTWWQKFILTRRKHIQVVSTKCLLLMQSFWVHH